MLSDLLLIFAKYIVRRYTVEGNDCAMWLGLHLQGILIIPLVSQWARLSVFYFHAPHASTKRGSQDTQLESYLHRVNPHVFASGEQSCLEIDFPAEQSFLLSLVR